MSFKFYFCLIVCFNLIYSIRFNDASSRSIDNTTGSVNNFINKTEINLIRCPKQCVCVDLTGNKNQSFIELNSFETNCTNLHLDLENVLKNVPNQTTHLYLYRITFSKDNQLKLPVLNKLKFLKLSLNTIKFIDEDAFQNIPNLNTLKINYNQLDEIPKSISKLEQLKNLILQNNRIKSIDKNAFAGNPNLESIEIKESSIDNLDNNAFKNLINLKKLTLSSINRLGTVPNLMNDNQLEHLTIDRCEIRFIPLSLCDWLPKIKSLIFKSNLLTSLPYLTNCTELQLIDLSYNFITNLDTQYYFPNPNKIIYLFLRNNLIKELEETNLAIFTSLQVLDLESNSITQIHPKAFANLTNLRDLNLGKNKFPKIPTDGLQNILKTFGNINLKEFPAPIFFPKIQKLALSYAYHCCEFMRKDENEIEKLHTFGSLMDELDFSSKIYEKVTWLHNDIISSFNKSTAHDNHSDSNSKVHVNTDSNMLIMKYNIECIPRPDPFMPCDDLFDFWTLRCSVWLVFLLAVLGNATVIVVMLFGRTKLDVPRFLVCNLALADFLMGIYLCILALVDSATLTVFRTFAVTWQNSFLCSLAGFLAVFSTESSVFILAVITLERNYAITNAMHLNKRLSLKNASIIMVIGYIFVFILAVLPLFGISSYQKFAVCLPFEIEDSWSRIYVLSLVIFNGVAFLILIGCYLRMYCAIRGSQVWFSNDSRIAKRMSLLVFTDFLCWSPIALCTVSSVFFNVNLINLSQAKIFTIFILPLNSCCNPFLYAIFTKQFKKDCVLLCKKLEESRVTRGIGGCKHSSNFSNRHTPDCTNSIEKHYSEYLYCRQLPGHQNFCNSIGCTNNLTKKQQFYSNNKIQINRKSKECLKGKSKDDDVFNHPNDQLDEENLLRFDLTNYFLKNRYNLILNRIDDGSKLVCKCGITTVLPKSRLFFDTIGKEKVPVTKVSSNELKDELKNELKNEAKKDKTEQATKQSNRTNYQNEIELNLDANEDVFVERENDKVQSKSKLSRLISSFLIDKLFGKKERKKLDKDKIRDDKNGICDKCDCQLNANEMKPDLNSELFFKQHAERLHQQLIKSKQRLDSISSENFSSRSDSLWRQQASQQLKLIEKYFNEKVKHPGLIRYDRKNSTTGSLSTSTFRISRSSVSSDNFKPFDHRFQSTDKRGLIDEDFKKQLLFDTRIDCKNGENKTEVKFENNKLIKNQINSEVLNNLFKQFLCSECAIKNDKFKDLERLKEEFKEEGDDIKENKKSEEKFKKST